ncbi:MAG: TIGR04283 family arsenosugar biosynthesis glycosyltransferase [Alphaproteobacteria bacterium]
MLSVVIPTLDGAADLERTFDALAEGAGLIGEIVVADGGSRDGTPDLAARLGARVVSSSASRGAQLAVGAQATTQPWLLFLHGDTRLEAGWTDAAARFIAAPENRERAAYFRFALDDGRAVARRIEVLVAWRCRALALPYGDQGLLIARAFHDALGGFRPMPLMEDVEMVRRIGRRRLVALDVSAVTSATRFRQDGYFRRSARNLLCVGLYFLGLPPRALLRLYE